MNYHFAGNSKDEPFVEVFSGLNQTREILFSFRSTQALSFVARIGVSPGGNPWMK
jgi:hypothetical protein